MMKRLLFLLLFFFAATQFSSGQVIRMPRDTTKVYSYIERYSKKRKFTKFVHRLIFKPTQKTTSKNKKQNKANIRLFEKFEGKIIRKINIVTLDPFGQSVDNPERPPKKWIEKAGNGIHIKTRKWTIRNNLLFKENEPLDSLLVKESERLVQQQRYIRNVTIKPVAIPKSKDSVDISIIALDSWSLVPTGSVSSSNGNLEITERNFMGVGHQFENNFRKRFEDGQNAYGMRYIIPNFKNTFINTTFIYDIDFDHNYVKSLSSERNFFSSFTRLAGGIGFQQRFYTDSLTNALNQKAKFNFKFETLDLWVGHSFRIFKGKTEDDRITNLVTTLRFANQKFIESPTLEYDPIDFYSKAKLYLNSIGITSRKFIQNKYIFNNGIPEYVQIGKTYTFTSGFQEKNFRKRAYYGGRYSFGGFYSFGYLSSSFEVGSFINNGTSEQTTFRFETLYFSDLIEVGNWKIRQFIQPQIVLGNNRLRAKNELININENNGIQGFNTNLTGTKKLLATFQTQTYVPGSLWGFRISPFFNTTLGMIGDDEHKLLNSRLYSKFGLGVLISNDYMVFNSFQISFAYYPTIPGTGDNQLKSNTFKNNEIELPDFQVGKPYVVPFQ
ncbi:hypothetical protein LZZ90_06050 [Flavobacterium sp. SM15]|uniref:hypothetical protein n=1 Tax=Flavobacterium sp. SM15 TaxID=2908005 RepID=UPI001EDA3BE2|nr:hypothetical protein [Flavobacterium sp. SM15]MCG2611065.1 hypothetical protein [Flavobacterium sp. SM15]